MTYDKSRAFRKWLIAGAISLSLIIYGVWVEPNWLEVAVYELNAKDATERIRIVQLSDLHLRNFGRREAAIAEQIQKIRPDILVLSGDVIDSAAAMPVLARFLETLGTGHQLAVLGNWEYWGRIDLDALRKTYEDRHRVKLLVNQGQSYRIKSRTIYVAGMDDFTAGQPNPRLVTPPMGAGTTILVQHSPGWFDRPIDEKTPARFDLCLSGHTHGGQVTLFGIPLWTPPGSGHFGAGFYDTPNCKLYVSRGIGTSILPVRIGARPEIAVFDL